ncbi:DNA polymerase delta catalytic subunit-like [Homalodisca vitripennis]|uniref:DNA polymerase delta catalytic subunit-like n=1 Tax=Homalodisca vitripennis TaxID=197043 RepID=UPI001EE9CCE3|nr:DNA polymerase delta catalytic subunit-like [Homalodisca vitripennis]
MEPFFYLHAELEEERFATAATRHGVRAQPITTCLSIFGKDARDETVVVRVHMYRIQFYVSFRDTQLTSYCCTWLAQNAADLVVSMETVHGFKSMLMDKNHQTVAADDFADTTLSNVVRLKVRTRRDVTTVVRKLDEKVYEYYVTNGSCHGYPSAANYYESNLDVIVAATRDLGLDACQWCLFDTRMCTKNENRAFVGNEYSVYDTGAIRVKDLFARPTAPPRSLPPHVKIMSFDIECLSAVVETMPDASRDPVIQISAVVSTDALGRGQSRGFRRHLFTTGGPCASIEDVQVVLCRDEAALLRAFVEHVHAEDPDIVSGYNVCSFDLPYLFKRIEVHGVEACMGRGKRRATCKKRKMEAVRQYASFMPKTHDTLVPGRVVFDMYTHMRKEVNLRSYTLNSVSTHFLKQKKDDVGYREIPALYHGDDESRARLGRYCVKDAQLVLELAFKTQTFVHAFERCKVFRTMLQYMVERGQQVRFYSMLLAWCADRKILVNDVTTSRDVEEKRKASAHYEANLYDRAKKARLERGRHSSSAATTDKNTNSPHDTSGERSPPRQAGKTRRSGYEGATVLDPVSGMYHTPVICLDFASLYPSIMIAYNLCVTTFVRDERSGEELTVAGLAERSPAGYYFLASPTKKGVVPSILEMLLEERADVRRRMRDVDDGSIEYMLLDGQQLALKIAANSIYGAMGCDKSILNFVEIPSSVTAYGRQLILRTKEHVENLYAGTQVLYGDTDSLMVNMSEWDPNRQYIWDCAGLGKDMADSVTRAIDRAPIRLQFETVYKPFLLCTKKRYAAGVYNCLDKVAASSDENVRRACRPTIKYKGLQVVRRDNCTFATRLMEFTLETLMSENEDGSIVRIATRLRDELTRLFQGRVNMKELVISKEWKKKGVNAQAHDILARRMQQRDPNSAPSIGDRVPYVIVTHPKGARLCDRAEDPLFIVGKRFAGRFHVLRGQPVGQTDSRSA